MDMVVLAEAPTAVRLHIAAAFAAIVLGPVAIYRKRRDLLHRCVGASWVVIMTTLAVTGLMIPSSVFALVGPFGPIHLLSLWVLWSLATALRALWRGQRRRHGREMRALYWQGLALAGALTLLPGRRLNAVLFPEAPAAGLWVISGLALGAAIMLIWRRKRAE